MIGLVYALLWLALLVYLMAGQQAKRWLNRLGITCLVLTLIALTCILVQRALLSGHWPLTNRYEFSLCFLWAIMAVFLLLEQSWSQPKAAPYVLAIALIVATYTITRPASEQAATPLLPALRSVWLQLHVLSEVVGYATSAVAAGLGLMYLLHPSFNNATGHQSSSLNLGEIEHTMERVVALGFPWLSLGILTGAIWAQTAWGRYWGWDPKESWALVTWLWYLLILHVRSLHTWRGHRLAWMVVAGFGVVLFTLIGVPWLVRTVRLESLHGF